MPRWRGLFIRLIRAKGPPRLGRARTEHRRRGRCWRRLGPRGGMSAHWDHVVLTPQVRRPGRPRPCEAVSRVRRIGPVRVPVATARPPLVR